MGFKKIFYRTFFPKGLGLNFEFEKSLIRGARELLPIVVFFPIGLFVSVKEMYQKRKANKTTLDQD